MALLAIILGLWLIMSLAVSPAKLLVRVNIRRRSPSVMIPTILSSSTTAVTPSIFSEISTITFFTSVFGLTWGFSFREVRLLTLKYSVFPKDPRGWNFAKSLLENPRRSKRHIARASPITNWAVVLVVGARLLGQASFST